MPAANLGGNHGTLLGKAHTQTYVLLGSMRDKPMRQSWQTCLTNHTGYRGVFYRV